MLRNSITLGRIAGIAIGVHYTWLFVAALTAFIFVRSHEMRAGKSAAQTLAALDEVQEVHHVAGEDCFLVKVRAADTHDLHRLIRDRIGSIPQVTSTRTTIVLETVKETLRLPLESENGAGDRSQ